jgi:uncharacterized protein DUF6602
MSAASKGEERGRFIDEYLSKVLPPPFRCGRGDVTDTNGERSGQVDVVVEYPFLPSLPSIGSDTPRLYLAEGVAAVIEVKSDLAAQWGEVLETAKKVAKLNRDLKPAMWQGPGPPPGPKIPFFAAGYLGWAKFDTVIEHLDADLVKGILVIDSALFASTPDFGSIMAEGSWALWGLICCLHNATTTLKIAEAHPLDYAR